MTVAMRVYVPSDAPAHVRTTVEQQLTSKHGGATTYDARGSWSDDDRIVTDDMTVIESVADATQPATDLKRLARYVRDETNEDAVMWDIRPVETVGFE